MFQHRQTYATISVIPFTTNGVTVQIKVIEPGYASDWKKGDLRFVSVNSVVTHPSYLFVPNRS